MRFKAFVVLWLVFAVSVSFAQETSSTEAVQEAPVATATAPVGEVATAPETSDTETSNGKTHKSERSQKSKAPKETALKPTQIYVAAHCDACAGLIKYLRQAGVVLAIKKVEQSNCSAFPTVVYSDGQADHGERIYNQQVPLPRKLGVQECERGA